MTRSKIHLNIHKESAHLFEIVRVSYLLANRCFVLSESGLEKEMEAQFRDGVAFCAYDELAERCRYYLDHPQERQRIAEAGFELFPQMPQTAFLATALQQHNQVDGAPHGKATA